MSYENLGSKIEVSREQYDELKRLADRTNFTNEEEKNETINAIETLSDLYSEGFSVTSDKVKTRFKVSSVVNVDLYELKEDISEDFNKSGELAKKAYELGGLEKINTTTLNNLALYYDKKDTVKALEFAKESADRGDKLGKTYYGTLLINNGSVEEIKSGVSIMKDLYKSDTENPNANIILSAIETGTCNIAYYIANGENGARQNTSEAIEYCNQLTEDNKKKSLINLANKLYSNEIPGTDEDKIYCFEIAAKEDRKFIPFLAYLYHEKNNIEKTLHYCVETAKDGYDEMLNNLAIGCLNGSIICSEDEKIKCLEAAARNVKNNKQFLVELAEIYIKDDKTKDIALNYYVELAESGNSKFLIDKAKDYLNNRNNKSKTKIKFLTEAYKYSKDPIYLYGLGCAFGDNRETIKSVAYLEEAVRQSELEINILNELPKEDNLDKYNTIDKYNTTIKNAEAELKIIKSNKTDKVTDQKYEDYCKMRADLGNIDYKIQLAKYYFEEKKLIEAADQLEPLVKMNVAEAQTQLIDICKNRNNYNKLIAYYNNAADKGDENAKESLQMLQNLMNTNTEDSGINISSKIKI